MHEKVLRVTFEISLDKSRHMFPNLAANFLFLPKNLYELQMNGTKFNIAQYVGIPEKVNTIA